MNSALRATWGVVTTANEPPELLAAFAAHHLRLGASEVRIFVDNADPQTMELLALIPGCVPIACDADYWAARPETNGRPRAHIRRQRLNATLARSQTKVDWLGHLDADEFLMPLGDIGAELAAVPSEAVIVVVMNGERLWIGPPDRTSIFSGAMRLQMTDADELARSFGNIGKYTIGGLSSYARGKLFVRTSAPVWIGIHSVGPLELAESDEPETETGPAPVATSMRICHFDGLTPLNWILKLVRYDEKQKFSRRVPRADRHRFHQVGFVARKRALPRDLMGFHNALKTAQPAVAQTLIERGVILNHGIDPAAAVEALVPGLKLDFSMARFDAWLKADRAHLADFIAAWQAAFPE